MIKMEKMKIKDGSLDDLIQQIKSFGYDSVTSFSESNRKWRIYNKVEEESIKLAYISEYGEVMATQKFKQFNDTTNYQKNVRELLTHYNAGLKSVRHVKEKGEGKTWIYVGVGAVLGVFALKFVPIGLIVGGGLGYFSKDAVQEWKENRESKKLDNYLKDHNIFVGKKAMKYLNDKTGGKKNGIFRRSKKSK